MPLKYHDLVNKTNLVQNLLSVFNIYQSVRVLDDYGPVIMRNNCVYATLVLVILCGLCIPDSHPHNITGTKCRINTVVSPDDGPIVVRNMYRLVNFKHTKKHCAQSLFYLQDYKEMHGKGNLKIKRYRKFCEKPVYFNTKGRK
jgi:hypothetical protein